MMTSAGRNESRLTAPDIAAMSDRIAATMSDWPATYAPSGADYLTLERAAAHAIGCGHPDLRDSELDVVMALVADAVNVARANAALPDRVRHAQRIARNLAR